MKTGDAETGSKVLEFYKEHPFNYRETIKEHVKAIKCQNSVNAYPELQKLLEKKKTTVLEVGCGVGWLSNALAYHHKCLVTGLLIGNRAEAQNGGPGRTRTSNQTVMSGRL